MTSIKKPTKVEKPVKAKKQTKTEKLFKSILVDYLGFPKSELSCITCSKSKYIEKRCSEIRFDDPAPYYPRSHGKDAINCHCNDSGRRFFYNHCSTEYHLKTVIHRYLGFTVADDELSCITCSASKSLDEHCMDIRCDKPKSYFHKSHRERMYICYDNEYGLDEYGLDEYGEYREHSKYSEYFNKA